MNKLLFLCKNILYQLQNMKIPQGDTQDTYAEDMLSYDDAKYWMHVNYGCKDIWNLQEDYEKLIFLECYAQDAKTWCLFLIMHVHNRLMQAKTNILTFS